MASRVGTRLFRLIAAPLLLAATAPGGDDRPTRRVDPTLQERINVAIERGVAYLKAIQQPDGSWPYGTHPTPDATAGLTALALYALAASKVPPSDPAIEQGVKWTELHKAGYGPGGASGTYSASLLVLALTRIDPERYRARIHRLAEALVESQLQNDLWTYRLGSRTRRDGEDRVPTRGGDNSNSQFAVLALWAAAALAGYEVPERTWHRIHGLYARTQLPDGGWGYMPGQPARPSMTSAGLCSYVYATAGLLGGAASLPAARADPVARRGLAALLDGPRDYHDYYFLYALERAGTVMAIPLDLWYVEGARALVARQEAGGRWGPGLRFGDAQSAYETSLALLFLSRATAAAVTRAGGPDSSRPVAFPARVGPDQLEEAFAWYARAAHAERRALAVRFAEAGTGAVGFLVGKLRAREPGARAAAYEILQALVEKPLFFEPRAGAEERDLMLGPIEAFWRDEGPRLRWDETRRRFVSE